MPKIDVSVVIPAHNEADSIRSQLEALSMQEASYEWEVVVSDNNSTDGTDKIVESFLDRLPGLRVVRATRMSGAGYARNKGAAEARGSLLLFCDADDVVMPGWLQALADGLKEYDAVGGPLEEESLNKEESRIMRGRLVSDHLHKVFGFPRAVSANCGVRRDVFQALGGFDTSYLESQDTEFFIRLQVNGYTLGFVPEAVVRYRHEESVRANLRKTYRWQVTRPRLYKQYRKHGARKKPLEGLRNWGWLVLSSWYLFGGRKRRLQWVSYAVQRWGRLVGSIKHRSLYL